MQNGESTETASRTNEKVAQKKSLFIKNLVPGLTERGKIKIGRKGDVRQKTSGGTFQLPVKLNHFIITTLERDTTGNFIKDAALYAALKLPDEPKEIPVRLLFDSVEGNFQSRYACYHGTRLWCSGDGECADRITDEKTGAKSETTCPCHRKEPAFLGDDDKGNGKCKINGTLQCIIDGANCVGGVWKLRTTGYNTTVGIYSSLMLLKSITGGVLAGIPLMMRIQPKIATNPIDGKSVTIYIVGIEYRGTITDLHKTALQIASESAVYRERLANVANEARQLISVDAELMDQAGDIQEEFYPEDEQPPQLQEPGLPNTVTHPIATATGAQTTTTNMPTGVPAIAEPKPRTRRTKAQLEAAALAAAQPAPVSPTETAYSEDILGNLPGEPEPAPPIQPPVGPENDVDLFG